MGNLQDKIQSKSSNNTVVLETPVIAPEDLFQKSPEILHTLTHPHQVSKALFNSDRTKIITACFDGIIRVWETRSGDCLFTSPRLHKDWIRGFTVTKDFTTVITCGDDCGIVVFDLKNEKVIKTYPRFHRELVTSINLSHSENVVLTTSSDGTGKIWNPYTGDIEVELSGGQASIRDGCFSHSDEWCATASSSGMVNLWTRDVSKKKPLLTSMNHSSPRAVTCVKISLDDAHVFSCGDDSIKIWDSQLFTLLRRVTFSSRGADVPYPYLFSMNRDGAYLIDANNHIKWNPVVRLWDLHADRCMNVLIGHSKRVLSVEVSRNLLLSTSSDRTVVVWNVEVYAREKLMLLLCLRARVSSSVWYKENLPLDVFKLIIKESNLWAE